MNANYSATPIPHLIADGLLTAVELAAINAAWDQRLPLPKSWPIASVIARMAGTAIGPAMGLPNIVPDLSNAAAFQLQSSCVVRHTPPNRHPHLDLSFAATSILFVHQEWSEEWGGELQLEYEGEKTYSVPVPSRMITWDARAIVSSSEVVCPTGKAWRVLVLDWYSSEPLAGERQGRKLFPKVDSWDNIE